LLSILIITASQGIQFLWLAVSSRAQLSAEVLFLRKQLAFYQEHPVQPRKLTDAARFSLALWSQLFNWRASLMIVKPETLIGWHRKSFKPFWRWMEGDSLRQRRTRELHLFMCVWTSCGAQLHP